MSDLRRHELIVGGLGGQGVLTIAKVLANAATNEYKYVTFFPQYMATMRGGPCYSTVILSDEKIMSPIISRGQVVIVMEGMALSRYSNAVREGGLLIGNSSLLQKLVDEEKNGHRTVAIPASDMALELGSAQSMNFIMFGAYLKLTGAMPLDTIAKQLEGGHSEANLKALEKGYEFIKDS